MLKHKQKNGQKLLQLIFVYTGLYKISLGVFCVVPWAKIKALVLIINLLIINNVATLYSFISICKHICGKQRPPVKEQVSLFP